MARIKSALEIALERTESVKSDKDSIDQFEAKQRGKKLAGMFIAGECDLAKEIKNTQAEHQKSLKQGIFELLVSQISLPASAEDEPRIEAVGKGLQTVIKNSEFAHLYGQFAQAILKFQKDCEKYEEAIHAQYAPKLRQKEEELSRRLGSAVRIDPFKDPEFVNFYNQNMNALKAKYQAIVDEVREEAKRVFEQS